jgi:hypothetical protein
MGACLPYITIHDSQSLEPQYGKEVAQAYRRGSCPGGFVCRLGLPFDLPGSVSKGDVLESNCKQTGYSTIRTIAINNFTNNSQRPRFSCSG